MSGRDPEDFLSKPEKKGAGGKQKVVKAGSSHNGSLLHAWICQEASNRGETLRAAAKKIGKTYGYFYQLNTGVRDVESVSNEFVISCARYLGIPPIVVKLAAGKIAISDWLLVDDSAEEKLNQAFRKVCGHPRGIMLAGQDPDTIPEPVRRWIVETFSELIGEDMYERVDIPSLLKALKDSANRI